MRDCLETFPEEIKERTTKTKLITQLEIARSSFYELLTLSLNIPDFEEDYPESGNRIIRSAKLSRYQAWVIFHLNQYRTGLGIPLSELRNCLESDTKLFYALTKETYLQIEGAN